MNQKQKNMKNYQMNTILRIIHHIKRKKKINKKWTLLEKIIWNAEKQKKKFKSYNNNSLSIKIKIKIKMNKHNLIQKITKMCFITL